MDESRKTPSIEDMEKAVKNYHVDEAFKPWLFGPGTSAVPIPENPEPWNCSECGMTNITSRFCPQCGTPYKLPEVWECSRCGKKGLTGNFCTECGSPRTKQK